MLNVAFGFLAWLATTFAAMRSMSAFIISVLVVYPFLPRYIGIPLGSEDFAMSFRRIIVMTAFLLISWMVIQSRNVLVTKKQFLFVLLYITTITVSATSGFLAGNLNAAVFRAIENFTLIVVGVFLGAQAFERFGFEGLIKYAFVWPLYLIVPMALAERITGFSLFYELFGLGGVGNDLDAKAYRTREGLIRAQASFVGPLQLSEFLVLSLSPLYYMLARHGRWKWVILIAGTYLAILSTGSRTGLVMMVIVTFVQVAYSIVKSTRKARRRAVTLTIFGIFSVLLGVVGYKIATFEFVESFRVFEDAEARSIYSRLRQYPMIFETLRDTPFFGMGYARNQVDVIGIAIDNFYLWTALEGGWVSVAAFVAMILLVLRKGIQLTSGKYGADTAQLGLTITTFISAYAIQKAFLQSPTNLLYFFIVAGTALSLPLSGRDVSRGNLGVSHKMGLSRRGSIDGALPSEDNG